MTDIILRPARWLFAAAMVASFAVAAALGGCAGGAGKSSAQQVVVYAAEKDEIVQAVGKMWAETVPEVKLSVIPASSTEVIQRVRSEAGRPLGDVVWGVGAEGVSANSQLFEPYVTSESKFIDPRWLAVAKGQPWIPNNVQPHVLIYNTRLVPAAQAPKGWRDLTNPKWRGRLGYTSADSSGSAYTQLAVMVSIFGNDAAGWRIIGEIMRNAKIVTSSGRVPKGVADGEYAVGMTYENIAGQYAAGGSAMKIVYPAEGTAITPDCNALIEHAPHPEAAKRFLDFLVSKPVQEMLARDPVLKLSLRSCRTDVAAPPGLPPLDQIKAAPKFDFRWAVEHRKELIKKWQDTVAQLQQ